MTERSDQPTGEARVCARCRGGLTGQRARLRLSWGQGVEGVYVLWDAT